MPTLFWIFGFFLEPCCNILNVVLMFNTVVLKTLAHKMILSTIIQV